MPKIAAKQTAKKAHVAAALVHAEHHGLALPRLDIRIPLRAQAHFFFITDALMDDRRTTAITPTDERSVSLNDST